MQDLEEEKNSGGESQFAAGRIFEAVIFHPQVL